METSVKDSFARLLLTADLLEIAEADSFLLLKLLLELDDNAEDVADIGDIPRNAGIAFSPGISGISSMPVNRGRADIPVVSDDISVPSSMLLFLKAELDEADDDEEKKEADLLEEEDEEAAAILLLTPIAAKSPEVDADSLLEAELDEVLLDAPDMAQDPSGET